MSAQVILTVTQGPQSGQEFVFTGRAECVVGRARGCAVELPDDFTLSRHHCLLEVNGPAVAVQDLGSLNGTFVNGERIGGRPAIDAAASDTLQTSPPRPLTSGDELRVGGHVLRVEVVEAGAGRKAPPLHTMCV